MRVAAWLAWMAVWVFPTTTMQAGGVPSDKTPPTLLTVRLPTSVRKRIERTVFGDEGLDSYAQTDDEKTTEAVRVSLGPDSRPGLRVRSGHQRCGATGNCVWWIFDPATGSALLNDGLGCQLRFLATLHHGLYDVKITQNLSCCDGVNHIYHFDGQQYRQVREQAYSVKQ
jgi:hypothetical protein